MSFLPCPELREVLAPAYAPCASFTTACRVAAKWSPATGHVPRGFVGAFGSLAEVKLVLLIAEPGDPFVAEAYPVGASGDKYLSLVCTAAYEHLQRATTQFHANLRYVLDRCWPGEPLGVQLRRTWITETFLCSATRETAEVPRAAEAACASRYLVPQLALLVGRPIIALGGKAQRRIGPSSAVIPAFAVAPPGANQRRARPSWNAAARAARMQLGLPSVP